MTLTWTPVALAGLLLVAAAPAAAAPADKPDVRGCQDLPTVGRMPGFWLQNCSAKEFDAYEFVVARGKKERVEGKLAWVVYLPQPAVKSPPSALQVLRNYEAAVRQAGGTVVFTEPNRGTYRIDRGGRQTWIEVGADHTSKHRVTVLERGAMRQDLVLDADALLGGLAGAGHVAVAGLYFDTGLAELKPESGPALAEVARLLARQPALRLFVVGHTDTVGTPESNLALSQARAEAVLQALVREHGVAAARLRPFGAGPFAPVASNDVEAGRAQNRRVELVKQ
jgi:outer membrane protein OmpA-like peptidoglycan-associated protein